MGPEIDLQQRHASNQHALLCRIPRVSLCWTVGYLSRVLSHSMLPLRQLSLFHRASFLFLCIGGDRCFDGWSDVNWQLLCQVTRASVIGDLKTVKNLQ